jgi:glycosyltransferase involved in cell wall biosynthesis
LKTKLLIFYDHFYPSYKAGGPTQSIVNLVKALHKEYNLYIICKPHEMGEKQPLADIQLNKWTDWEKKAQVYYWGYGLKQIPQLKQNIASIAPNVIYINGLYSLYFNFLPLMIAMSKKVKIILAPRGMLHEGALSQKTFKKKFFLLIFKLMGLHNKVIWHATDETEVGFIKNQVGDQVKISTAPNLPNLLNVKAGPGKKENELILGTIALISPMKNHLEVLNALKLVKSKVLWHIYGPVKDADYWKQCNEFIKQLPSNIQVQYHGDLPPSLLEDTMQNFQVFILPSKSENFGHALAEAISAGKPIITSKNTPFSDIENFNCGIAVSIPSNNQELANAIEKFAMMDAQTFNLFVSATQDAVAVKFKNTDVLSKYYSLFNNSFAL